LNEIGESAFSATDATSIRIPGNVEKIGGRSFSCCTDLGEVLFDAGSKLKEIHESAFSGCAIQSILLPSSLEKIGKECFSPCESLSKVAFEIERN
jgi:hypothetical protein